MTERKPPGVDFESWIDRQVREAEARGEFANLPGKGKPLPSEDAPYDEMWWVKRKMREEGVSYLPATLVLRKEVEDALADAVKAPSELVVRRIVAEVNERIETAMRTPMDGPPHNLTPVEVEDILKQWRDGRQAERSRREEGAQPQERGELARAQEPSRGRGWWPWRGRRAS